MSKAPTQTKNADKRLFFFSLAVFLFVSGLVVYQLIVLEPQPAPDDLSPVQPASTGLPANAAAQLTAIPAELGSGDGLYGQLDDVERLVNACADYNADRRTQMALHISWLRSPELIPLDVLMAMGSESVMRLVLGMSTFTRQQWQALDSPADSCLVPIGQTLNQMLAAVGGEPAPEFAQ